MIYNKMQRKDIKSMFFPSNKPSALEQLCQGFKGLRDSTSVHFSTSVHSRVDVPVPMIHFNSLTPKTLGTSET